MGNKTFTITSVFIMIIAFTTKSYAVSTNNTTERLPHNIGLKVYQQNCSVCHGQNAEGALSWKVPNSLGELPAPPHNQDGHTWRHSDAMLQRMIKTGWRDPFNKTKRLTMPAFGETLSPIEINAVIDYMKTLWTPAQVEYQQKENSRR
ncbi:cytochrome c [Moritella sp. 24]|uniref:c-type cytochrome n=1 Tax=Moritella sp. 24 TaxID=2746230 RepID=UPI0021037B33|nr:cytochrome c [Moritella sp. 24]